MDISKSTLTEDLCDTQSQEEIIRSVILYIVEHINLISRPYDNKLRFYILSNLVKHLLVNLLMQIKSPEELLKEIICDAYKEIELLEKEG